MVEQETELVAGELDPRPDVDQLFVVTASDARGFRYGLAIGLAESRRPSANADAPPSRELGNANGGYLSS